MRFMYLRSATLLAALALLLGGPFQPARAATTVDVTYDLADSGLAGLDTFSELNRSFAGTMTVRYASDGGLGIVSGPATVLSLTFDAYLGFGYGALATATMTGRLLSPVAGNLAGTSLVTGLGGWALAMSGSVHCKFTGPCTSIGLPVSIPFPISGTGTGKAQLAGPIGPYGGATSTPHTLTGSAPASLSVLPGIAKVNGIALVGRELRRTDGTTTKVIPEPGTLLLLGAGAAGLGALGRVNRRSGRG